MINRKIRSLGVVVAGALVISSCSKKAMDEVNRDLNHATDVQAKFIITEAITNTAFSVVGGDPALYSSVYLEHEAGVWNQTYNAETRTSEPTSATTYNNAWNEIYINIKNLKIVIAKTSAGGSEAGNSVTGGVAKVMLAYNLGVLTDFYGDVPFSEAGEINADGSPKFLQPKIDKQSDLYPQIQKLLDEAITMLGGTDAITAIGAQDLIYGGNKAKWIKAAYALKARYLMHTIKRSAGIAADMNKILEYIGKSFTGTADEMIFNVYDGSSNINPLFGISNSRDFLGVSKSLATKFKDLNDPRGGQAFIDYNFAQITVDKAIAQGVPNGTPVQQQFVYPISAAEYAPTAPTQLFSYHELMFLKAEALVRLGRNDDAKAALKEAVIKAFANLERSLLSTQQSDNGLTGTINLGETVATAYFNNQVVPRFNTAPLRETMLQKYLAFYGASGESTEAYNDYRRLKATNEAAVTLANPLNSTKFPLRFSYGNSDVTTNPVVKAAYGDGSYVYTENVWWAGGTR